MNVFNMFIMLLEGATKFSTTLELAFRLANVEAYIVCF